MIGKTKDFRSRHNSGSLFRGEAKLRFCEAAGERRGVSPTWKTYKAT
jgi:hypothetical protein